ncbi:MAG: winged helix-turn-helix domain-containing protein [Bryobacteraceae bacterium]
MEPTSAVPTVVRFGIFEADLASGELRKRGRRVPLQDQPFQILAILLRRRGELVTREELQQALWPADTFVEFEHGINMAVQRLRQALGDSADSPRYIETLPRKGYRFIAPVEVVRPAVALETADPAAPAAPAMAPPSVRKRRRWVWMGGVAAVVVLVLITGLWPPPQPVVRVTPITEDARYKGSRLAVSGGRVIYSAEGLGKDADKAELWSVPAAGGEARREPAPCESAGWGISLLDVSYAHQRLFLMCRPVAFEADLWLTGFEGSSARAIGHYNVRDDQGVSISPDLETLLFSRREGLFVRPVDRGAERLLARVEDFNFGTFWHPAGDRIGFLRRVGGLFKVWEVRADGAGPRPLIPEFVGEQYAAQWSPDGQRLYFVSKGDIYLQRARGWLGWVRRPVPARLTSSPIQFSIPNEDPANPLAVYSTGSISQATAMKLDRKTNIWEPFLGGLAADCFNYSPDGQWIVYVTWPKGGLWKCRRDGSSKQVLEDGLLICNPRWSPDGTRIAFAAKDRSATGMGDASHPFHIYTIPASGGKPEPVPGVPGPAHAPDWSHDGKRLVFAPVNVEGTKEERHVSIVNLETGAVEAVPGSENLFAARWSPDGKWLVALSCDKMWPYVYSFATQKWGLLQPSHTGFDDWSRDSRSVYFTEPVPEARLVRIEVATGKLEEVHKLSEFPITGVRAAGAFWTPDKEPVVLKDLSSSQIYRIERDR